MPPWAVVLVGCWATLSAVRSVAVLAQRSGRVSVVRPAVPLPRPSAIALKRP
ncbi:hypothetical protein D3C71_1943830 [compost metagenome]